MCTESHRFTLPVRSCYSLIPDWHHDLIAQPSQRIVSLPSFFEHQNSGLRLSEEPEGCGTKSICLLRACQELDDYETGRKWITAAPSRERKSAGALLQSAVADWHTDRYSGCGGRVMRASAAAPSCWLLQLVVMMSAACCGCQHVSVTQSLGPVDETRSC